MALGSKIVLEKCNSLGVKRMFNLKYMPRAFSAYISLPHIRTFIPYIKYPFQLFSLDRDVHSTISDNALHITRGSSISLFSSAYYKQIRIYDYSGLMIFCRCLHNYAKSGVNFYLCLSEVFSFFQFTHVKGSSR